MAATVFCSMFGSMVGRSVGVPGSGVALRAAGSIVGVGGSVPVGVQGTGWKGVIVGDAFGAAVTNTNGRDDWAGAGARVPQPARRIPASKMTCSVFFMRYSAAGLGGVLEAVKVGAMVGEDVNVALGGMLVSVGLSVFVDVGKSGTMVTPGTGVRVGTLGTHSR
jgi:hypothetical protein